MEREPSGELPIEEQWTARLSQLMVEQPWQEREDVSNFQFRQRTARLPGITVLLTQTCRKKDLDEWKNSVQLESRAALSEITWSPNTPSLYELSAQSVETIEGIFDDIEELDSLEVE